MGTDGVTMSREGGDSHNMGTGVDPTDWLTVASVPGQALACVYHCTLLRSPGPCSAHDQEGCPCSRLCPRVSRGLWAQVRGHTKPVTQQTCTGSLRVAWVGSGELWGLPQQVSWIEGPWMQPTQGLYFTKAETKAQRGSSCSRAKAGSCSLLSRGLAGVGTAGQGDQHCSSLRTLPLAGLERSPLPQDEVSLTHQLCLPLPHVWAGSWLPLAAGKAQEGLAVAPECPALGRPHPRKAEVGLQEALGPRAGLLT